MTAGRCDAFAWIGQPFTSCENCGRPYWDHQARAGRSRTPFGPGFGPHDYELIEITTEEALAVRRKWGGTAPYQPEANETHDERKNR